MTALQAEDMGLAHSGLRKAAVRFVPLLLIAYVFNYLDRTSIGFAALTMNKQLGLTNTQFGLAAGMFFAGYCIFEIPSNMALYRFGARRWIARIMITWGIASALTAFVVGPNSFYLVRILLGIAEAGFFPGVTYFLAAWFPPQYRTRMLAWFVLGITLSSVVGGPICGSLLQLDGVLGLAGWKWLFLGVSLPCVIIGLVVLFLVADSPQTATFLTSEEKTAVLAMQDAEVRERPKHSLLGALGDLRVWILAFAQFCFTLGSYGIGIFLPLIMAQSHLSSFAIGWLSSIPYIVASIAMLLWAYWVDFKGRPILNMGIGFVISAIGLCGAYLNEGLTPTMIWLTVALVGLASARAIFWGIPTRFLKGAAAAGGLGFINTIGTFGGFCGPYMMGWLKDATGSFQAGIAAMGFVMVAGALLTLWLRLVVTQE